jgi:predicted MFS family arabinose efflux permease
MLTQAAATMAAYTLSTASPYIAPALGVENEDVAQLVAIVYLMGAVSAMIVPPFIYRYGGMLISVAICLATAAMLSIASFSTSIGMLALGALSLGFLYGSTAPSSSHVLAPLTPANRRNLVFSIRQIGVPLGGILGGLLVPPLILFGGWRLAFQAQLIFALGLIFVLCIVRPHYDRNRDRTRKVFSLRGPLRLIGLLRELPEMRSLSIAAFIYSGTQLCFGAFIVTQLVRVFGQDGYHFASAVALVTFQLSGITTRIVLGVIADTLISARWLLVAQGALMTVAAIIAAGYGSNWPYWLIIMNCALAGATASGYTGLAFAEFARMGGGQRIAEATGLGAALMFFGVAAMTPLFRLGIDIFDGYTIPYLSVAVLTGVSAILLAFGTRK